MKRILVTGLKCFTLGCPGGPSCGHLRWLDMDDGTWVQQCSPTCTLQLVRPGKVQCDCPYDDGTDNSLGYQPGR